MSKRHPGAGGARPGSPAGGTDAVWALIRRAQGGDTEAFGEIYDRYVDAVHRFVYYRVADRGTAEDLTADTFLRAFRRLDTFTDQGRDIGAWLTTIARNLVLDHVKSSRYRLETSAAEITGQEPVEGPERAVLIRLDTEVLLRCLRLLSPEQQECVTLRFLHEFSVAETAEAMGRNDGAVKALQHRALRRLGVLLRVDTRIDTPVTHQRLARSRVPRPRVPRPSVRDPASPHPANGPGPSSARALG